jgi:hypothetical protein
VTAVPDLNPQARRLLAYFVANMDSVIPGDPKTYFSYKRVHADLGLVQEGPTFGISLSNQGLDALAVWARDSGLPAITGLVVKADSFEPASGYFKLLGRPADSYRKWAKEIERAKVTDWSPYLNGIAPAARAQPDGSSTDMEQRPQRVGPPTLQTPGFASVWRLIPFHIPSIADSVADEMVRRGVIAIGWPDTGDLDRLAPRSSEAIGQSIKRAYPGSKNHHTGGASLWHFWHDLAAGDLVIVGARSASSRHVVEVTGGYRYSDDDLESYRHQRNAVLTALDPDELWHASGAGAAEGESARWTLARLSTGGEAAAKAYEEGERYEVRSTAIERNPRARQACIDHHEAKCFACGFDFSTRYGELGEGYIHVHHRKAVALSSGPYLLDPVRDLIPLCPNCHAMIHRYSDPADVEGFIARYWTISSAAN